MITIILTCVLAFTLGSIVTLLLTDGGTKGITQHKYTTKDGKTRTARKTRGDYIV